jgi:hypothetical protein
MMKNFSMNYLTSSQIKREANRKPILSRIYDVKKGGMNLNDPVLEGYQRINY